jgi:hypothetical protein
MNEQPTIPIGDAEDSDFGAFLEAVYGPARPVDQSTRDFLEAVDREAQGRRFERSSHA